MKMLEIFKRQPRLAVNYVSATFNIGTSLVPPRVIFVRAEGLNMYARLGSRYSALT